ncbi:MAG: metallophosphoesterase [Proteobacteria bacterium]|nr:metallophosphoesterase [Pseudomonadota bacterium]
MKQIVRRCASTHGPSTIPRFGLLIAVIVTMSAACAPDEFTHIEDSQSSSSWPIDCRFTYKGHRITRHLNASAPSLGCRRGDRNKHFYTFNVINAGTVTINVAPLAHLPSHGPAPWIQLLDKNNTVLAERKDNTYANITMQLEPGDYQVMVTWSVPTMNTTYTIFIEGQGVPTHFMSAADTQYGYFYSRNYHVQTNETMANVLNRMLINHIPLLTVSGDLNMDNLGRTQYGNMFKTFVDKHNMTVVDARGNHDKFGTAPDERTYFWESRVHKNKKTRQVDYTEWLADGSIDMLYYAHRIYHVSIGSFYLVSLGESAAASANFLAHFMNPDEQIGSFGGYRWRNAKYDPELPIVVIKHRENRLNWNNIVDGSSIIGVIYGHWHCANDARRVSNDCKGDLYTDNYSCANKHELVHEPTSYGWGFKQINNVRNRWNGEIRFFNVAAAFAGAYFDMRIVKNATGYELQGKRQYSTYRCYHRGDTQPAKSDCPNGSAFGNSI